MNSYYVQTVNNRFARARDMAETMKNAAAKEDVKTAAFWDGYHKAYEDAQDLLADVLKPS